MRTKAISLEQIQVAKPCPTSWEEMTGNDSVRFCSLCQLNVYNLSALTKVEAEKLITQTEGRLCVKFYQRADGTVLTQDCPVGLRAFRKRVSRITATAFSTLLSLFTGNSIDRTTFFAQDLQLDQSKPIIKRTDSLFTTSSIEGSVTDAFQSVIYRAQVTLTNQQTKRELFANTSEMGRFGFYGLEPGEYTIKVSYPGFKLFTYSGVKIEANEILDIGLKLDVGQLLGELVVIPEKVETSDHILPNKIIRKEKPLEQ